MPDLPISQQVDIARAIATIAHRGQTDKGGEPYIGHPERVAASFKGKASSAVCMTVAWLHDVLEDTDLTRDDLHAAGIGWSQVVEVERLTHAKNEPNEDYYRRVRESAVARQVKLADIADNTDPSRLDKLDGDTIARLVRKYAKAKMWLDYREPITTSPDAVPGKE